MQTNQRNGISPYIVWHDSDGELHRDDGPALISKNGDQYWFQHGKRHRDDGPAIEWLDGDKFWYSNDKRLSFDKWLDKVNLSGEEKVMMKLQYG